MRHRITILCALFVCAVSVVKAQQTERQKELDVIMPPEIGLLTIAFQPDCPLQFERAKLLAGIEGERVETYQLRNRGTKPIRSITIVDNSGSKWSWRVGPHDKPVMPGQLAPPWGEGDWDETVPLTDELRDQLKHQTAGAGVAERIIEQRTCNLLRNRCSS